MRTCWHKHKHKHKRKTISQSASTNAYVNDVLTEHKHKHKHKKKAYAYAYVAAVLTSAQASYAYVYACFVGEDRPGFFHPSRPGWETGHNHTPPLNLFRAFPCAPPYARSIFWWSPLLLLSWSPSHGNYPFIEHPQDMHVQHFWICSISVRISIATRKIPFRSCDC